MQSQAAGVGSNAAGERDTQRARCLTRLGSAQTDGTHLCSWIGERLPAVLLREMGDTGTALDPHNELNGFESNQEATTSSGFPSCPLPGSVLP